MGMLNAASAAIWRMWQGIQARSTVTPSSPGGSNARVVYVPIRAAGIRVHEDNAIAYSAVFACTRIIAETIASLTWHVFRELPNGGKERVPGPVQHLLRDQANPETSAFAFRENMVASALLWGNGYAEIVRDGAGRVIELWQIAPDRVSIDRVRTNGRLVYDIDNLRGDNSVLEKEDVFHLHGLGFDGLSGYSVVRLAAQSIGIGMAADKFAASFYANGTWVGGLIKRPVDAPDLSEVARNNIRQSFEEMFRGPDKAFRPAILEEGMEWQQLGMPLKDAEFIATRKYQVTDIARWFRVPPHKLADLERATFSNIEHQSLEFVQDTILPWAVRLEQQADIKLFGQNRAGLFTKLNLNALLRGDVESRYRAYTAGRQWGWLSANDIRELEDMNPIGPQGDSFLVPLNMVSAKTFVGTQQPAEPQRPAITVQEDDEAEQEPMAVLRQAHSDLLANAFDRIAKREEKWAESAKRKFGGPELSSSVLGFLTSPGHREYQTEALMPPLLAFARIIFAGRVTADVDRILHDLVELTLAERRMPVQDLLLGEAEDVTAGSKAMANHLIDQVIALRMTIPAAA